MEIGEKIRYLRIRKNMTQEELANKLNISRISLNDYENVNKLPDSETLTNMANFFGVSEDELLDSGRDLSFKNPKQVFERKLFILASMLTLFNVVLLFMVLVFLDDLILVGSKIHVVVEQYVSKYEIMYFLLPFLFFYLITVAYRFGSFKRKKAKKVYVLEIVTIIVEVVVGLAAIIVYFINFDDLDEKYVQFIFCVVGILMFIFGLLVHPAVSAHSYILGFRTRSTKHLDKIRDETNTFFSFTLMISSVIFTIISIFIKTTHLLLIIIVPFVLTAIFQQYIIKHLKA